MAEIRQSGEEIKAGFKKMNVSLGKVKVRIETGHEPREAEIKIGLEEVKTKDLEANPEEIKAVAEHQEVTNKEAIVDTIRALETLQCPSLYIK